MKSCGEITHPILMPIFNFCKLGEYLLFENLTSIHLEYTDMRFLMSSGIQKNSIVFLSSWCLPEPYAFYRDNQITWSSTDLLFFTIFIRSHYVVLCSIQPRKQIIPTFRIGVLTWPLFITNLVILFAMILKNILPSTLNQGISRNWSSLLESSFLVCVLHLLIPNSQQ